MCSSLKVTSKQDKHATGAIEPPYVCVNVCVTFSAINFV